MPFNIPLVVTGLFFFGSIGFAFLSLFNSFKVRDIFRRHKYAIIFLLIANIFFKYPVSNQFFHGQEYEDAYVYNATGRYLAETQTNNYFHSFWTDCCVWGNLTDCQMSATYSGHVIGFPFILYLCNISFGFYILTANLVSLFLSCISVVTLFCLAFYIINDIKYSVICSLIFILIPVFNVYSSTAFSEPTSMAFVAVSLLVYLDYMSELPNSKLCKYSMHLLALFFLMGFIILIKRENLIVPLCLPLASLIYILVDQNNIDVNVNTKKIFIYFPITFFCILMAWCFIGYFKTNHFEEIDIGTSTFSISFFIVNIVKYCRGLFIWNWYLFVSFSLLAGISLFLKYRKSIGIIVVYLGYLLLYTFHYRSYYFIKGGGVSEIEFVHYMINMILIYSLIAGIGFYHITNIFYKRNVIKNKYVFYGLISILSLALCGLSYYQTYGLRKSLYEDEYKTRILPIKRTLDYIGDSNVVVITLEPLIFQIIGPKSLELIDITAISSLNGSIKIDKMIDSKKVYFLDKYIYHNYYDLHRWPAQMEYLNNKKKEIIFSEENNFTLYKIVN